MHNVINAKLFIYMKIFHFINSQPENPLPLGGGMNGVRLPLDKSSVLTLPLCVYSYSTLVFLTL